jgi:pimeloyl-ACP methyl ester carboxylesterase
MITTSQLVPGMQLDDCLFRLPLDHAHPGGRQITVFARAVMAVEHRGKELPWLLFLQGGPGFEAPRPLERSGWLGLALQRFRVLLLDQRGTGRSERVDLDSLQALGDAAAQAAYLAHFRSDAIVRDAEAIRIALCGDRPWTVLGQSYGGFCALSYLSLAPQGLAAALVTGGLPPLHTPIDEVYRATYKRVVQKNAAYHRRYPRDRAIIDRVLQTLDRDDVRLPDGARLSSRRFLQLGLQLGFSDGFESIHYLLEDAFRGDTNGLSYNFLRGVERLQSFDTNPLFAILHEAIYCEQGASNWSAARVLAEYPEFERERLFTGEMIYPWMFEEYTRLRPLAATAELLAQRADWPPLYDSARLAANRVPVMAAVYAEDMYVERRFSEATASQVPGMRVWLSNEYEHNGLRANGPAVLGRLLAMLDGVV